MDGLLGSVHALHLVALALWVGGLAVLLAVLGARGRVRPEAVPLLEEARRRGRIVVFWAVVALIVTLAVEIVAQAAARAGDVAALAPALRALLFGSRYGLASLARWLILVASLFAVDELGRAPSGAPGVAARVPGPGRQALGIVARPPQLPHLRISRDAWLRLSALLAAALLVCTAVAGPYGGAAFSAIVETLRLGGAALWLGGTIAMAVVVPPAIPLVEPGRRAATLLTLLDRFTPLATLGALALAATALWRGAHPASPALPAATPLIPPLLSGPVRIGALVLIVLLSAWSALVLRPRLRRASTRARRGSAWRVDALAPAAASTLATIVRVMWLNLALAAAALLLGALGDVSGAAAAGHATTGHTTAGHATAGPAAAATSGAGQAGARAPALAGASAGALRLTLRVTPNAAGPNTYDLRLSRGALPVAGAGVTIEAQSLQMRGMDPPAVAAVDLGAGRYQARGILTMGGRWRLRVVVHAGAATTTSDMAIVASPRIHPMSTVSAVSSACTRLAPGQAGVWQPLGPKLITHSLVADPANHAILYAGTIAGVYRSLDGGTCWTPASAGLYGSAREVWSLTLMSDGSLMAGTGAGIYRSTDGAAHWRLAGLSTHSIYTLAAHLAGHVVLLAGGDGGVYRSDDLGGHWRGVYATGAAAVTSLAWPSIRPDLVIAGISPAAQPIAVSHDGGTTWQRQSKGLPSGPGMMSVAVAPGAHDVYAGSMGLGLYASPGISGAWQGHNGGLQGLNSEDAHIGSFAFDHDTPTTLYIATDFGVYRSLDAGGHWRPFGRGLDGDATVVTTLTLVTGAHPVLYACTAAGLYRQPLPVPR